MAESFPDVVISYDANINASAQATWAAISDFGNWPKWTSSFTNMKIEGDGVDKVGCIRSFQSTETGTLYEERELEKDETNFVLKFGLVSAKPATPFIEKQVVSATVVADGDDKCIVHYIVTITPNVQLPEDKIEKFKGFGKLMYDKMFGDLQNYLKTQQ